MISIPLLYSTCDKYKSLMPEFFVRLKKYMPFFNGKVYTNIYGDFNFSFFIKGLSNNKNKKVDNSFSSRTIALLESMEEDYFLFMLDDFYLTSKCDEKYVTNAIELMKNDKTVGQIILHDLKGGDKFKLIEQDNFIVVNSKFPYIMSTQASIVRKTYFLEFLRKGESIWDFEHIGSYRRTKHFDKWKTLSFFQVDFNKFLYPDGGIVSKGKLKNGFLNGVHLPLNKTHNICLIEKVLFKINPFSFVYPFLSAKIKKLKRFGRRFPSYVEKRLDVGNDD